MEFTIYLPNLLGDNWNPIVEGQDIGVEGLNGSGFISELTVDDTGVPGIGVADQVNDVITISRFKVTPEGPEELMPKFRLQPYIEREVSNENEIVSFAHCSRCLEELPPGKSPQTYSDLSTGFTPNGLQVWCNRHECNVVNIDFQNMVLPANTSREDTNDPDRETKDEMKQRTNGFTLKSQFYLHENGDVIFKRDGGVEIEEGGFVKAVWDAVNIMYSPQDYMDWLVILKGLDANRERIAQLMVGQNICSYVGRYAIDKLGLEDLVGYDEDKKLTYLLSDPENVRMGAPLDENAGEKDNG